MKEEEIDDDSLFVQEIHNSGDEENDTVVGDIDMVEHKIEIDEIKRKEEESVDDPLTTHQEIGNSNICEDIKR